MKLPNVAHAIVAQGKIAAYLLKPDHAEGGSKARFFLRFGFTITEWEIMAAAFHAHAITNEVETEQVVPNGMKYTVVGALHTPDGRAPLVRSVWQIDSGATIPRFITAVPYRGVNRND
ncbi:MAG: DUF6883 domain-containing protein [Thermomicrobiales bacterium]